jgi:hypothetical protein
LTAAALLVGDAVHQHTSVRGETPPDLHPLVRRFLHELPVEQTERYTGWCAEVVLVSDRLYAAERAGGGQPLSAVAARAALWGAQLSLCLIRPAGDPDHGRAIAPCRSCAALLEWLGIDVVAPDPAVPDPAVPDPVAPDRAPAERAPTDRALTDRAPTDRAPTDRAESDGSGAPATERFPEPVRAVLAAAGWAPDRYDRRRAGSWALALAAYATPDGRQHTVVDPAVPAFAEFGGVTVTGGAAGEQVATASFRLDPRRALYSARLLAELGELLGVALTPIGDEGDGLGIVAVDELGRVFVLDHTADWYLGASLDEALRTLILGRMPARLRDDGAWQ